MKKAEEEFRMKWRALDQQWQKGKLTLDKLNEKQDALTKSYAKEHAIEFAEWVRNNATTDGAPLLWYHKENKRMSLTELYNEWITNNNHETQIFIMV